MYRIQRQQYIPTSLEAIWAFFSAAANLERITPPAMVMRNTSPPDGRDIYPGQIITYSLRPLPGIRMRWVTEITHVVPGSHFVDEQRYGPYSFWHHQHHFSRQGEGVLMTDIVHYKLPLGPLGHLAHAVFVKRQLQAIFEYRRQKIAELFPS